MYSSLAIPFNKSDITASEPWLTLKQNTIPKLLQSASTTDILNMWAMVISGISASTYISNNCPVSITNGAVTVFLGVYVYPCTLDMEYTLSLSNGTLGEMELQSVFMDFDLIIPQSDSVSLDFVPLSDISFTWQTKAYNNIGEVIDTPEISVKDNVVSLTESCFGVLRCTCTALAQYYPIDITVVKTTTNETTGKREGLKITNFSCTVQATWKNNEGEVQDTSLSLEIPECVKTLLETCGDGNFKNVLLNLNKDITSFPVIYYSACDGKILGVFHHE